MTADHRPRLLMCPPDCYGVEYVINPWMEGQVGRAKLDTAQQQWHQLHDLLSQFAEIELITPGPRLPDMCFAANAGLVIEKKFVCSSFRVHQRQPEEKLFARWFDEHGWQVIHLPDDQPFEGEGDALIQPGQPRLWAGYGVRSCLESHRTLCDTLQLEVVSLRLVDQRFYHLDTCFLPLPNNHAIYFKDAFDDVSIHEIRERIPESQRLEIDELDAASFACNAVRLGQHIILNAASEKLTRQLQDWGYQVHATSMDEFMLAGGAAKCLTLLLDQDLGPAADQRGPFESRLRTTRLRLTGHLLDTGLLNRAIDVITDSGGSCHVEEFAVAARKDQHSTANLRVTAADQVRLDALINNLMPLGVTPADEPSDVQLEHVVRPGVAPDQFYATTIYPTDVRVAGHWYRVDHQRMDAVIVVCDKVTPPTAECRLIRNLEVGDRVVCGVHGLRVITPTSREASRDEFSFMSAAVSSERRVELVVDTLAWEMRRIRAREGRIVVVAGPVVIHTGGGRHLERLIRGGYVQALLTGNALPVHDIELDMFGTSLGVDLARGVGIHGGHTHHLRAINRVRSAGNIAAAVEAGIITGGVMHACVKHDVEYVLAGSIRDDGPLPDTLMDLVDAQAAYAAAIEDAEMILMLSSMLHAIGTGNMTKAGVRLVCVDISPAVVTKLADRGSVESTGIVTDVGLFLHLLAARLFDDRA
ncbi:MAG: TIGR00300 family protein [Planctomycetales bacterium]|nr:TIGR00300 family protein [Planctomycetales bacterium]